MALSDFVQNWEAGGAAARSDKARKSLASYMQGDQSALAGVYANDPQAAMQAQQFTGAQKQSADQEFVKLSSVYAQSKDPATYAGWRQAGIAAGRLPPETPSALTDPADVEGSLKTAQAWAGGNQAEQFTLAPGSTRYDASGRVIAEQPFAPAKPEYQLYDGADGPAWLPKPTGAPQGATTPFSGMGTPGQPPVASGPALDPTQDFPRLASAVPGVQNTSLFRDPKNNNRVGGVANSQHMKGTAGDFVVPQPQRQQFMQQARSMGYEAIDEGDHVHVELPPGRTAANRFGAGQGLNAIPVAGVRPKPKAADSPSALQERIEMAKRMGASEAELRQMVIGKEGAAAGAKPMPVAALKIIKEETDAANTATAINTSLDKHLKRIQSGKLDFGPIANQIYAGRNAAGMSTEESRNFAEFKSDLEKLRNDSLRLNNGVQTDGDAQRAWNELVANINDTNYVKQRLQTIKQLNERARNLRQLNAEMIRENYGRGEGSEQPAPQQTAPKRLKYNPATGRLE